MVFKFPEKEELKVFLKDILEDDVDEKYYLKQEQLDKVLASTFQSRRALYQGNKDVCSCLAARDYKEPKIIQLNNPTHSNDRIYSDDGISPTLNTMHGGNRQPFVAASRAFPRTGKNDVDRKQILEPRGDNITNTISTVQKDNYVVEPGKSKMITLDKDGNKIKNVPEIGQAKRIYSGDGVSPSLNNWSPRTLSDNRIRKLTPIECFRLMGFLNDEINLDGLSNTQRYKLAGNGWDINLVSKIFKEMDLPDNLKLFEMFSGYGGASFALKKAGIDFECIGFSEIDKYAIQCYQQNHKNNIGIYDNYNKNLRKDGCTGTLGTQCGSSTAGGSFSIIGNQTITNFGDCTQINPNELPDFDLLTGGFPCQSFSAAGKGRGELDTRGTLFNEIIRIAEIKKPKYMLLENVKGLTYKNHRETFNKILSELERIGYDVKWKVLNSKEYGIPQNRERVFFVCFRKDQYI